MRCATVALLLLLAHGADQALSREAAPDDQADLVRQHRLTKMAGEDPHPEVPEAAEPESHDPEPLTLRSMSEFLESNLDVEPDTVDTDPDTNTSEPDTSE